MIPLFKPSYGQEEIDAVSRVLESGWSGMGAEVAKFEEEFARYTGCCFAVAVNSGTSALNLAVKCLVDPGSFIITTPISFVSTASAIIENRCYPLFVDVDPLTMNLDPDTIPKEFLELASAILPVHYGGRPCDMAGLMCIARTNGLTVIEDCAHAAGAEYRGTKAGNIGDIGCFSFHAVKNLSCGDGGMITTNDLKVYERLKRLRWCGIDSSTWEREGWEYEIPERGSKCHMNDITAAIGRAQLGKLDQMNENREILSRCYGGAFSSGHSAVAPMVLTPPQSIDSAWHLYPIQVWDDSRSRLYQHLKENGVTAGVHYKPIYEFEAYRRWKTYCPNADLRWKRLLSLPMYPGMTLDDQDKVIKLVKEFVNG